jgi:hypothetical protein
MSEAALDFKSTQMSRFGRKKLSLELEGSGGRTGGRTIEQ